MFLLIVIVVAIFLIIGFFLRTRHNCDDINEFGVYRDGNGTQRFVKKDNKDSITLRHFGNNKSCTYSTNDYGEEVIKDLKTGKILLNCDLERAIKNEKEAKKKGESYFVRVENSQSNFGASYGQDKKLFLQGKKYCHVGDYYNDIVNNLPNGNTTFVKVYVKRRIECLDFKDIVEKFGINDYVGYYFMSSDFKFVSPCTETMSNDKKEYGDEYLQIEQFIIEKANEYIKNKKKGLKYDEYIPIMPLNETDKIILGCSRYAGYNHRQIANWR